MASSTLLVSACPRWSFPVTLGGGMTIMNTSSGFTSFRPFLRPYSGLKKPCFSHQAYQAASTYWGLYASGRGHVVSFLSPGLVPLSYFAISLTSFGSFLGFFSFLSSSAFCSACTILYHQWCNEYVDCKRLGNPLIISGNIDCCTMYLTGKIYGNHQRGPATTMILTLSVRKV